MTKPTTEISTPAEMYAEALARHHPSPTEGEGFVCSCGKWQIASWSHAAFNAHVAEVLATMYQPPGEGENGIEMLRHFYLDRDVDVSGVSGVGEHVAEGFVMEDGVTVLHWLKEPYSTSIFASVEALRMIHGHHGDTRLVPAIDEQPMTMPERMDMAHRSRKGA